LNYLDIPKHICYIHYRRQQTQEMTIMAIGERIHFFRIMRGMTQKYLGMALGFPEKSADVRLAQYETGTRTPKADVTEALAQVLDVSPKALDVPDIDSYIGLMHTLFTLEDRYGLEVCKSDGEAHLRVNIRKGRDAEQLSQMLEAWKEQSAKLAAGEISREEYDRWRYHYPDLDTSGQWHKVTPSQELSDMLTDELKNTAEE
jgi:transcriptional regulator with XRE-family HTH domain